MKRYPYWGLVQIYRAGDVIPKISDVDHSKREEKSEGSISNCLSRMWFSSFKRWVTLFVDAAGAYLSGTAIERLKHLSLVKHLILRD